MKISALQNNLMDTAAAHSVKQKTPEVNAKLQQSSKELEGLFISHVLKVMRSTIPKESGQSGNLVDMMFSSVMGESLAEQGGIGLSKYFYDGLAEKDLQRIDRRRQGDFR